MEYPRKDDFTNWFIFAIIKNLFLTGKYIYINPKCLYIQGLLESGFFTSPNFRNNKNIFGIQFPRKRLTTSLNVPTAIVEGQQTAVYSSYTSSVQDALLRAYHYGYTNIKTPLEFYNYLKRTGYAKDKRYINKLDSMSFNYEDTFKETYTKSYNDFNNLA